MARRCKSCNTWNEDVDHCVNCGAVISLELQEKLDWEAKQREKAEQEPEALELWFDRFENSKWFLVRVVYHILHSIWVVIVAIASFFMYFIAWVAG